MEPLALLCNLYGNGPATSKRLQRAGCDSLGALLELEPDELADHLDWSEEDAERFLREALLLIERLEGRDVFEVDDEDPFAPSSDEEGDEEDDEEEDPFRAEEEPVELVEVLHLEDEEEAEEEEQRGEFEDVLDAWRDLDRGASPEAPTTELIPQPPPPPAPPPGPEQDVTPLDAAACEGLSEVLVASLREQDIHSLEALVMAPTLELARSLGLGFTRLSRVQFLARRALAEVADDRPEAADPRPEGADFRPEAADSHPEAAGVPAPPTPETPPRGEGEADRLGASGPFA